MSARPKFKKLAREDVWFYVRTIIAVTFIIGGNIGLQHYYVDTLPQAEQGQLMPIQFVVFVITVLLGFVFAIFGGNNDDASTHTVGDEED